MKKVNYTAEMTKELVEAYNSHPSRKTIELYARKWSKTEKSIIGKLSKEGVYRREGYRGKTGDKPITKEQLRDLIELETELELEGLEKAPKTVLKRLCYFLEIEFEESEQVLQ